AVVCDSRASLVVGTCAEARAGRHAVRLDVEPQRVTTVGQRRARVHEQLGQVGDAGAPRALVYGDRRAERPPRESWHRVHALLARGRGGIPVPHGDGHGVHARAKADELLEDHALVGSQRLLEGADPYRFIARDLPGRSRVGAESDLHVVLGDEYVAVTLEAQGMVRERQGEHSQGGVGGRVGGVAHGGPAGEGGPCAFKVLRQRLRGDPTAVKRFLREAGYGSRVRHPGVVRTYEYGEADGLHYLALEWAEGKSLADYVHRAERLAPAQVGRMVR